MARRKIERGKMVSPDVIYGNRLVELLILATLRSGKRSLAESVVYGALKILEEAGEDPVLLLEKAIRSVQQGYGLKQCKFGRRKFRVPFKVGKYRAVRIGIATIVGCARRGNKAEVENAETGGIRWKKKFPKKKRISASMAERLAREIRDASGNRGASVRVRRALYRLAKKNKRFVRRR